MIGSNMGLCCLAAAFTFFSYVHVLERERALGPFFGTLSRAGGNSEWRCPPDCSLRLLRWLLLQKVQERAAGEPLDALSTQSDGLNSIDP